MGRVYLVKEKKTDKLFAMKGNSDQSLLYSPSCLTRFDGSSFKEGNDRTQKNQACFDRAGDPCYSKSSIHYYTIPLISVRGIPLFLYGVLHGGRVLSRTANASWEVSLRGWISVLRCGGCRCVRVLAPHGIHLPRSQARK